MSAGKRKIFNDPIHGTIQLHPLLVKIIDTPEFQRLRHIKQMGGAYYVYPGAQHNRFEHSIGTAHLAGKLVRHLKELQEEEEEEEEEKEEEKEVLDPEGKRKKQKEGQQQKQQRLKSGIKIDDKDVLCVEIAGLCHDLGHGPFSHMFDAKFMKQKRTSGEPEWIHEQGSCDMFDRILGTIQKDIDSHNRKCRDEDLRLKDRDFNFIKEMINGPLPRQTKCTGRDEAKSFLYDIVSNKSSGVDVDKWDYFARDCHHLGIKTGFDHDRFIKCTRVIEVKEEDGEKRKRICVRDKEVFNLYEMFHSRFLLHKRACQHPVVNAVEHMICDALDAADQHPLIPGDGDESCKISECVENLSSFCNLDDRVLLTIQTSPRNELEDSKKILKRLSTRDLYKCVGNEILGKEACMLEVHDIQKEIEGPNKRLKNQLRVSVVKFNYGSGDKDPIQNYRFYKKGQETEAEKIPKEEVSFLLPDVFEEKVVQVFCVSQNEEVIRLAKDAFEKWYKKPEPSTNQLLRNFFEKTETLKGMYAETTKLIEEIRDSLDNKERRDTATKRKATSTASASSSKRQK